MTKKKEERKSLMDNKFIKANLGIVVTLAVILAIVLIAIFFYKTQHNFEYNGVDFKKHYYGNILLYTAKIPVKDYFGNNIEYRQADFRNDPRQLRNKVTFGENLTIKFLDANTTYLSFKENTLNCENNGLATINLAIFLRDVLKIKYKAALANQTEANEANVSYVTCETNPFNTVIYLHQGNETKITKRMISCYDIEFKNCEVLEATEGFELKILEQYAQSI